MKEVTDGLFHSKTVTILRKLSVVKLPQLNQMVDNSNITRAVVGTVQPLASVLHAVMSLCHTNGFFP